MYDLRTIVHSRLGVYSVMGTAQEKYRDSRVDNNDIILRTEFM